MPFLCVLCASVFSVLKAVSAWRSWVTHALLLAASVFAGAAFAANELKPFSGTAADFAAQDLEGSAVHFAAFRGKVVLLNFWATWCPPCISELPSLNAMAAELKGNGVVVLGVSVDKDQAAYQRFLKKVKLNFETSRDPKADISSEYGTFKYPETYVINTDGKVLEKFIADQDWMSPAIVARLRGYAK